jgi:predicted ester cyclase
VTSSRTCARTIQSFRNFAASGGERVPDTNIRDFFTRYIAVLNTHHFQRLSEFMHDELLVNGQKLTLSQMITQLEAHIDAVPDLVWRVEEMAVEGNQVAARLLNRGTPVREWLGSKPNGSSVEFSEHLFHKVLDGRFFEQNFLLDAWSVQKQLASVTGENPSSEEHS